MGNSKISYTDHWLPWLCEEASFCLFQRIRQWWRWV